MLPAVWTKTYQKPFVPRVRLDISFPHSSLLASSFLPHPLYCLPEGVGSQAKWPCNTYKALLPWSWAQPVNQAVFTSFAL